MILADDAGGTTVLRQFTHEEYVDFVERNGGNRSFYEREVHRITYRYADWAHIISTSEARAKPDGPVTRHGIDTLELFWDGKRWWIVNATAVVERPNAPLPKQFLPSRIRSGEDSLSELTGRPALFPSCSSVVGDPETRLALS